jgi:undecaprenyl-diphosphatase
MENLNHTFFLWLNAPAEPNSWVLFSAIFFAEYLILAIPIFFGLAWLRGNTQTRQGLLVASAAVLFGLVISQLIGIVWPHPRPFVIGLGHNFLPHAADSSFPSDHLTIWLSAAFSFLFQRRLGKLAMTMVVLALPMAWARIYLGVHYPADMLGAAVVAAFSAWLTLRAAVFYLPFVFSIASSIHRRLFGKLIALGWVSQ